MSCDPEVWDNNLILQLELDSSDGLLLDYEAGLSCDDLKSYTIDVPQTAKVVSVESIPMAKLSLEDNEKNYQESVAKKQSAKSVKDKMRSYSESNCDDFTTQSVKPVSSRDIDVQPRTPIKQRAYSECSGNSVDESGQPKHLKGILKRRGSSVWSISESSFDENATIARSADFTESGGEEHLSEHAKKSVRFDNNIRKFCFR